MLQRLPTMGPRRRYFSECLVDCFLGWAVVWSVSEALL
jgi:hypothetical protein